MATKKSAAKKTVASEPEVKAPAVKTAAKKTAAVKTVAAKKPAAKKTVDLQASAKAEPSHHDVSVQAYLLWEQDGKKHGHHEHYWKQAQHKLKES